ncbi:MAG: hypothetical protein K2W92_09745 [Alphaproteobacteria bacterium]|nr:hypothetical protein [Alphaproteobacteria bacterium]
MHKSNLKLLSVLALGLSLNLSTNPAVVAMEPDEQTVPSSPIIVRIDNNTQEEQKFTIGFGVYNEQHGGFLNECEGATGTPRISTITLMIQPNDRETISEQTATKRMRVGSIVKGILGMRIKNSSQNKSIPLDSITTDVQLFNTEIGYLFPLYTKITIVDNNTVQIRQD